MPTIINNLKTRLTTKITAMLLAALCVALLAIGYTLWLSWQLEGAAAAINDSGSLRMRAWKIAALLNQTNQDRSFTPQQLAEVKTIQQQFEITDATEEIIKMELISQRIQLGRQDRIKCEATLDLIAGYNRERSLTIEQITQMQSMFAQAESLLRANRPDFAAQVINAIEPDGVIITQEMKDDVLSLL